VGFIAEKIANEMKTAGHVDAAEALPVATTPVVNKPRTTAGAIVIAELLSPVSGEVVELQQVPDEAFASKAVGDGIAIKPTSNIVLS
ncbi:PTS glucose transporter subunit IIA, partial [Klebsiella pneumoniae]